MSVAAGVMAAAACKVNEAAAIILHTHQNKRPALPRQAQTITSTRTANKMNNTGANASYSLSSKVSWVRRRDWHILTSGLLTYTKEGRFTMHHNEGSTKWTLAIKYLKLEDQGVYECQVSAGEVRE